MEYRSRSTSNSRSLSGSTRGDGRHETLRGRFA